MRRSLVTALLVVPLATGARAESYDDGGAHLSPAVVHASLDGATAKLAIRVLLPIHGPTAASYSFDLPRGAVVTAATVAVDGASTKLQLMRADAASTAFSTVVEAEPGRNRRWAMLLSEAFGTVAISVAAPHRGHASLEVEATTPTCFLDDVRYVAIPASWVGALDVALRSRTIPDAVQTACSQDSWETTSWIALPSRELASQPPGEQRIGTSAGQLALGNRQLARIELDIAREMSAVPRDLATVIVIDGSRSLDVREREAQRQIVLSYARRAPDSRVQVIAYDRKAHALLPSWTLASHALPRIDRELLALDTQNGSNVEVGLAAAAEWLNRISGTRRVVLFTDERLADRVAALSTAGLKNLLPPSTLVHVVAIDGQADTLVRNDEGLLAPLATATEGLAVRGGLDGDRPATAELLVRPISMDAVTLALAGWVESAAIDGTCSMAAPQDRPEGTSCTWWVEGTAIAGPLTVEGLVWGHRVSRIVRPDPTRGMAIAREVSAAGRFDAETQKLVEDAAHALNASWSLFAAWGGRGGYSDSGELSGGGTISGCGCDNGGLIGHGTSGFGSMGTLSPLGLEAQLRNAIKACDADRNRIEITLETTLQEIVGLDVTIVPGLAAHETAATRSAMHDCVETGIWAAALSIQDPPFHAFTELTLGH